MGGARRGEADTTTTTTTPQPAPSSLGHQRALLLNQAREFAP